jgi:hypothetical protein
MDVRKDDDKGSQMWYTKSILKILDCSSFNEKRLNEFYQNEEESDEQSHSSGHNFRLDKVGDPRDDDEHETREVNLNKNLHRLALDLHLKKAKLKV